MSGNEILLFTQVKLRKFNLLHSSVMHCHACYLFISVLDGQKTADVLTSVPQFFDVSQSLSDVLY